MGVRVRADVEVSREELAAICRRYAVARLEVFGSSARGDALPGSDVDLLVEFEPDRPVGLPHLSGLQIELSELLGVEVDLVPRRGLKPAVREAVLGEARELYAG